MFTSYRTIGSYNSHSLLMYKLRIFSPFIILIIYLLYSSKNYKHLNYESLRDSFRQRFLR